MDMNYKKVLNELQNLKCYHKGKIKAFSYLSLELPSLPGHPHTAFSPMIGSVGFNVRGKAMNVICIGN